MLGWSTQHKIISDITLSFKKGYHVSSKKTSNKIIQRDKFFLNPQKYSTYTKQDFTFLVLYLQMKYNFNKIDMLKYLNSLDKDRIRNIIDNKKILINSKFYLKNDISYLRKIGFFKIDYDLKTNFSTLHREYLSGNISILGMYIIFYVYSKYYKLNRTQTNQYNRLRLFLSFFPKIYEQVQEISEKVVNLTTFENEKEKNV